VTAWNAALPVNLPRLIGAESCFSGANDCLCPIGDLELAKDIRDVILDGLDTQRQYVGDFVITPTLRN
jgi:hypothetical protein